MRILLCTVLFACVSAACDPAAWSGCSDGPEPYRVFGAPLVSPDGRFAVVTGAWGDVLDSCEPGPNAGALHVLDLTRHTAESIDLPAQPGIQAVLANDEVVVPIGSWGAGGVAGQLYGPGAADRYMAVPLDSPASARVVALPVPETSAVSAGGEAFLFATGDDAVTAHASWRPDDTIQLPTSAGAIAAAWDRAWITVADGVVAVSAATRAVDAHLDACPAAAIAPVGTHHLLLGCVDGGLGLLDVASGVFLVESTARVLALAGSDTLPFAAASVETTAGGLTTRGFVLGSGFVAAEAAGPVTGAVSFGSALFVEFPGFWATGGVARFDGVAFAPLAGDPNRGVDFVGAGPSDTLVGVGWYSAGYPIAGALDPDGAFLWSARLTAPPSLFHW